MYLFEKIDLIIFALECPGVRPNPDEPGYGQPLVEKAGPPAGPGSA